MSTSNPFKRLVCLIAAFAMTLSLFCVGGNLFAVNAQAATARQMEALDRGLVAVKTGSGVFLSWRLLGTESYATSFNVYRDGTLIKSGITDSTNYLDAAGSTSSS